MFDFFVVEFDVLNWLFGWVGFNVMDLEEFECCIYEVMVGECFVVVGLYIVFL